MAIYVEDQLPGVKYNGIKTNKPAVFNAPVTFNGGTATVVMALGTAAVQALPTATGTLTLTPTQNMTINATTLVAGQNIDLIVTTSGATSFTITFGTNFKSQGTLATGTVSGKVFTIEFRCDGVNYNEMCRTAAM